MYIFTLLLYFIDVSLKIKNKTAGPGWFDLPAPAEADLPHLYREAEALRLRNQLDPKRFYRKEEGEGKGIKGLPKHFAVRVAITLSSRAEYNVETFLDRDYCND